MCSLAVFPFGSSGLVQARTKVRETPWTTSKFSWKPQRTWIRESSQAGLSISVKYEKGDEQMNLIIAL
jgi:hypothetical protein